MPRGDDAEHEELDTAGAECTCDEFRRNQVCDHVLMAAAIRMLHRMIDIQKDEAQKLH